MNKDQVKGRIKTAKGKVKVVTGNVVGHACDIHWSFEEFRKLAMQLLPGCRFGDAAEDRSSA